MKFTDPVGAQLNLSEMLQILGNGYYFDPLIYTCMHSFKVFNVITFIAFEGTEKHLKISPKLQIQNLDQTLCSKSEQKSNFKTKLQLPKLLLTRFSASISSTATNSTSFELASSHAMVTLIKSTKQELVSEFFSPCTMTFPLRDIGNRKIQASSLTFFRFIC